VIFNNGYQRDQNFFDVIMISGNRTANAPKTTLGGNAAHVLFINLMYRYIDKDSKEQT
jgi:hypothetical protein